MPRLSKEFKQVIQEIPVEELQKLVIQLASKNRGYTSQLVGRVYPPIR